MSPKRLSLTDAIDRTLGVAPALPKETVALDAAVGRVLFTDARLTEDLPPFANAAMDGFALVGPAIAGADFEVRGESRAGVPTASGPTDVIVVAISTGAAMPPGATTVVPWEDVQRSGERIVLWKAAKPGQNVRAPGEDGRAGDLVVPRGTRLAPRHVAILATTDRAHVEVARRPKVTVLSTGDELVAPGTSRRLGQIVDSNGPLVRALAIEAGAAVEVGRVADVAGALEQAIGAAGASDLVVTIGGAADGDHDHLARAIVSLGGAWLFRGVAIKPGKPVALAKVGPLLVLALPGNPGSAYVTFALLGVPLLRAMQGDVAARPPSVRARTSAALKGSADRLSLVYGKAERRDTELVFVPSPPASSGSVPALARADVLAMVPPGTTIAEGDLVHVVLLDRG